MLIEDTARAIREAEDQRRRRLAQQLRLRRPVQQVDEILQDLEEVHLQGGIKVPVAIIARIEQLLETLPVDCRTEFPLRTTIVRVMDRLYAIQDLLLSRKDQTRIRLQAQDRAQDRTEDSEPDHKDSSAA